VLLVCSSSSSSNNNNNNNNKTTTTDGLQIQPGSSEPLHILEYEIQSSPRQLFSSETKVKSLAGQPNLALCKLGFATSNRGFIYVFFTFFLHLHTVRSVTGTVLELARCGMYPAANNVWKSEKVSLIN